jgi:hypothetical protein
MANPPASSALSGQGSHNIAIHLADRALTPLISSSAASLAQAEVPLLSSSGPSNFTGRSQAQSLTSLTTAAITAYDSAARLDLGLPQRILIETTSRGPVILHSYLNPQLRSSSASQQQRPVSSRSAAGAARDIVGLAREDLRPVSSGTTDGAQEQEARGDEAGEEQADGSSTVAEEDEEGRRSEEAGSERGKQLVNGTLHEDSGKKKADTPGIEAPKGAQEGEDDPASVLPPLLVATVVAGSAAGTMEARRAAAKLERMGREFQKEFVREEAESPREAIAAGEDG